MLLILRFLFVSNFGGRNPLSLTKKYFTNAVQVKKNETLQRIRNMGVIAHIDAGKTTVTERMLYLSGSIKTVGDVDTGNTITDFMEIERERGITIQSAAIFFNWLNHKINLIDTPGHADFSLEVERCARVFDAVVTVLDASAGVQAQTVAVWHQAKKFQLPCAFFLNKMDKENANFKKSLESIEERLFLRSTIPVSLPAIEENGKFRGVYDLIEKEYLDCTHGDDAQWVKIPKNSYMHDTVMSGREELLSKLADADEEFAAWLFSQTQSDGDNFDIKVNDSLRKNTLALNVVPVACGSALRCAASVRPLLNIVARYFPAPSERNGLISKVFGNDLSALVFKVSHDKRFGKLNYIRVYTGELKSGSAVYNASRNKLENRSTTFFPYSDVLKPVSHVKAGDIAVLVGLESTFTGDTLLQNENSLKKAKERAILFNKDKRTSKKEDEMVETDGSVLLPGIETPDPVFFCSIEPPDASSNYLFEKALHEITVEDPSVRIRTDSETGQVIIEAMGELHLEVVKDKLQRDYGLKVFIGPPQVAYREILDGNTVHSATVTSILGEKKIKHECSVTLEVLSKPKAGSFKKIEIQLQEQEFPIIKAEWIKALNEGCSNALISGPLLGFPVLDAEIALKLFHVSGSRVLPSVISAAASKCVREALCQVEVHLNEPVVEVEIEFVGSGGKVAVSNVLQEISRRRGIIIKMEGNEIDDSVFRIFSKIPVAETLGLSTVVRSLTSGFGALHMRFAGYVSVPLEVQSSIIKKFKESWK